MSVGAPAVFFDRDDTLMVNIPYLGDPSKVQVLPGVPEALARLEKEGFLLFVISNQSGVGRGLITREQVASVNAELDRKLGKPFFRGVYNCFAAPEDPYGSEERKPSPAMVFQARDEHGLDLKRSFFVGDRLSDVECGRNAGCRSVLVLTGVGHADADVEKARGLADFAAKDIAEAADWIGGQREAWP